MNKRGQEDPTGTNIVKLVIAILGIVMILVVIGIALRAYFSDISIEKASSSLDTILTDISNVPAGESKTITLMNPQGWYLVYFNENDNINLGGFEKPENMFGKKAVCVCKTSKCDPKACKEFQTQLKLNGSPLILRIQIIDVEIFNKVEYYDFVVQK